MLCYCLDIIYVKGLYSVIKSIIVIFLLMIQVLMKDNSDE